MHSPVRITLLGAILFTQAAFVLAWAKSDLPAESAWVTVNSAGMTSCGCTTITYTSTCTWIWSPSAFPFVDPTWPAWSSQNIASSTAAGPKPTWAPGPGWSQAFRSVSHLTHNHNLVSPDSGSSSTTEYSGSTSARSYVLDPSAWTYLRSALSTSGSWTSTPSTSSGTYSWTTSKARPSLTTTTTSKLSSTTSTTTSAKSTPTSCNPGGPQPTFILLASNRGTTDDGQYALLSNTGGNDLVTFGPVTAATTFTFDNACGLVGFNGEIANIDPGAITETLFFSTADQITAEAFVPATCNIVNNLLQCVDQTTTILYVCSTQLQLQIGTVVPAGCAAVMLTPVYQ